MTTVTHRRTLAAGARALFLARSTLGQYVGIERPWRAARPRRVLRSEKKRKAAGWTRSRGLVSTAPERRRETLHGAFFRLSARCLGLATAPCSGMATFYPDLVAKDAPNCGEFVNSAHIVNEFKRLQISGRAQSPKTEKAAALEGHPLRPSRGHGFRCGGDTGTHLCSSLAPLLGLGRSGRSSGCQTTLTYSDQRVAAVCRHDGESMKNHGESVEPRLVESLISSRQIAPAANTHP